MRSAKVTAVVIAVLVAGGLALHAAPPRVVTLQRVDLTHLPVVDVYLTVTDDAGASVLGLTPLEVTAAIDTTPQKITSLTSALAGGESLAVALLFDRSGSLKRSLDDTRGAAVEFIRRLSVNDRMAVVSFDDQVRVEAPFTSDRAVLEAAVKGIATGKDTALYDAIQTALDLMKGAGTPRQAVLVLSDGKDTKSTRQSADVLAEAKKRGVPVYTVALGTEVDTGVLTTIASETGGMAMKAAKADGLRLVYQKIADLLKNQYVLSFTSSFGRDEAWHTLHIEVSGAGSPAVSARREFVLSQGPGVSRELISAYERKAADQGLAMLAAVWAGLGLIVGLSLVLLIRLARPGVSLLSFIPIGIIVLSGLLGAVLGLIISALGT